jgi:hypothetical protein
MGANGDHERYDVFLSHSHEDGEWVHDLAARLMDEHDLTPWLDRWVLVPGEGWQRDMAKALEHADTCAICIGATDPAGWFENEMRKALDRNARDKSFRVIPVLLPTAGDDVANRIRETFLGDLTWVDFRSGADHSWGIRLVAAGVRGEPPGRPTVKVEDDLALKRYIRRMEALKRAEKHVPEQLRAKYEEIWF